MDKKIPVKTLHLLFAISIGLTLLGIGSTYAVFTATAEITNPIAFSSNLSYESSILETIDVTVGAGEILSSTLNITNGTSDTVNYTAWYVVDNSDVYVGVGDGSANTTGSLEPDGQTSVIVNIKNASNSSVTITIGVSSSANSVVLGSNMKVIPNEKIYSIVDYITNLYLNSNPTAGTTTTGGMLYYYSDALLMNDGLDANGLWSDGVNTGNIRYYGSSPKNYVDIGDNVLWRIIGVFKDVTLADGTKEDLVKIVRSEPLDFALAWDNKSSGIGSSESNYGSNNWSDSRLMMLLNPGYTTDITDSSGNLLNKFGRSYYWNSNGTSSSPVQCYSGVNDNTIDCYFDGIGLSETAKNNIENVVWNLGGYSNFDVSPNNIYINERGTGRYDTTRDLTWTGRVALMYPSDYGFASYLAACGQTLSAYNSDATNCTGTNWLFDSNNDIFLLTPLSSYDYVVWYVASTGSVSGRYAYNAKNADGTYAKVQPAMYLKADAAIKDGVGLGTYAEPYVLIN